MKIEKREVIGARNQSSNLNMFFISPLLLLNLLSQNTIKVIKKFG
jgi:hypothetical protein